MNKTPKLQSLNSLCYVFRSLGQLSFPSDLQVL